MCNVHSHEHEHGNHTHEHEHIHQMSSGHNHNHEEAYINVPRLGEKAPHFNVRTTMGQRLLTDYNGQWLVLFSYDSDFTPVSATELLHFAEYTDRFKALDAEILAVSSDSINSHIAWVLSLFTKSGVKIPFPLAADVSGAISFDYGLVCRAENAEQDARCLYIIDNTQTIRFASYYPAKVGRNALEILRVLNALKNFDGTDMAAPAAWHDGQAGIATAPETVDEAFLNSRNENRLDSAGTMSS